MTTGQGRTKKTMFFGVLLLMYMHSGLALADDCSTVKKQGKELAAQQKETRWMLYGAGGSVVLGPLGTGILTIVAAAKKPELPPNEIPGSMTPEQQSCFVKGYNQKVRSRRTIRVLAGGIPVNILMKTAATLLQDNQYSGD
jgi:hypothetical protein